MTDKDFEFDIPIDDGELDRIMADLKLNDNDSATNEIKNDNSFQKKLDKTLQKSHNNYIVQNPFEDISVQQFSAIDMYLNNKMNKSDIARNLGISVNTVRGWFRQEAFTKALETTRKEIQEVAVNHFQSLLPKAVEVLAFTLGNYQINDVKDNIKAVELTFKGAGIINPKNDQSQIQQGKTQIIIKPEFTQNNTNVRVIEASVIDVGEEVSYDETLVETIDIDDEEIDDYE